MTERKAKRRLKNFDFSSEGAHLALVHKEQGGGANGYETLIMKSAANFSEEFIEKMQSVVVEMELPDFLEKFFYLWEEDAKALAYMMGYREEAETQEEENMEYESEFRDWVKEKGMASFAVMKSLKDSTSIPEVLSSLSEDQYLDLLRDQEKLEKCFKKLEEEAVVKATETQPVVAETKKPKARIVKKVEKEGHKAEATEVVEKQTVVADEAKPAVEADSKTEVIKMTDKIVEVEKTETVEMVEKAQFDVIQKALDEQREELRKAQELLAQFEKERKEAVAKARKQALVEAIDEQEKADQLFKAVGELNDEAFAAVVEVVKGLKVKVETDPMFVEKGASVETEQVKKSALRATLESKYQK